MQAAPSQTPARERSEALLFLSPQYSTAAINLADLYRQLGRDSEGENVLRSALAALPNEAATHHALGLTLTKLKRPGDALAELHKAADLEPDHPRYAYIYAAALHSSGRRDEAITRLEDALKNHPGDREILRRSSRSAAWRGTQRPRSVMRNNSRS